MTWGWQDFATFALVASAFVYLARKFVPGLSPKPAGGCSHCPVKKNSGARSCCDEPVVIALGTVPPKGTSRQGFGS